MTPRELRFKKQIEKLELEKTELMEFIQNLHYGLSSGRVITLKQLENALNKNKKSVNNC